MKWQPIETAPLTFQNLILLFEPHSQGGFMFVGCWDEFKKSWYNNLDMETQHPTHWMPLPPPPEV